MKWRKWGVFGVLFAILSLFTLQPSMFVAAQSYSWTGEYYNNPYLQGAPAFTRIDSVLALDFGNNSPGTGVGSDGFFQLVGIAIFHNHEAGCEWAKVITVGRLCGE